MVTIDGRQFHSIDIQRKASILHGDGTNRTQDGVFHGNVIGTFYNYQITFANNVHDPNEYDEIYEILTAPSETHTITVPYGHTGTLTYLCYIGTVEDTVITAQDGKHYWKGLKVTFTAKAPART